MSPVWNDKVGTLSVHGRSVLRLAKPAKNQRAILNAFERNGWPSWIANPIEPTYPKDENQRLGDAVYGLNRSLGPDAPLQFRRDGQGKGVFWEFLTEK
jgi:hypothetical protein